MTESRTPREDAVADWVALGMAPTEAVGLAYVVMVQASAAALQNAVAQQQSYDLMKRAASATACAAILQVALELEPPQDEGAFGGAMAGGGELEFAASAASAGGFGSEGEVAGQTFAEASASGWIYEDDVEVGGGAVT